MRRTGESEGHAALKRLSLAWAQTHGFALCAPEVRVPRSGFRADVAACGQGEDARCALFECKQSRGDLLKDAQAESSARSRLEELTRRRETLERLLAEHHPDLRRGEALWPEYDAWDFDRLEHPTYRRVIAELATAQRRVTRGTKFAKMFRYRCADYLYLVSEDGIFAEAEIPAGWGLLVRRADGALELKRKPVDLAASPAQRRALLEGIALAGTRAVNRAAGLTFSPPDWTSAKLPKT